MMVRPLQPEFRIKVYGGKHLTPEEVAKTHAVKENKALDITKCVGYPVEYSEEISMINRLTFTVVRNADILLYYFYLGQNITLDGNYYSEDGSALRRVFSGSVTRIRTNFADNGIVTFTIEALAYGFQKLGKDPKTRSFPDEDGVTKFNKEEVTVTDVIKKIAEEAGMELGDIDMHPDNSDSVVNDKPFSSTNMSIQHNESDYQYLSRLARQFGCTMWTSEEDGVQKINVVHKTKAMKKQTSGIRFLYPLYGRVTEATDSEMIRHSGYSQWDRPRILRNLTVEENIADATSISRSAVYIDPETGDSKEATAKIVHNADGSNSMELYELDEARVKHVNDTMPEVAKYIRDNPPSRMPWGDGTSPYDAAYYYKRTKIVDETVAVYDGAYFGTTITAKTQMDLRIRSQRAYPIRGIVSYHSKSLLSNFMLRGLKHIWDVDGCWTELDFIR